MRVSVFDRFGALNSPPVFDAISQGLRTLRHTVVSHDLTCDVAVIWSVVWNGRMRANLSVWNQFRQQGRPVIVAEVGTLQRGRTWKLGLNGTGLSSARQDALDPNRVRLLDMHCLPWRDTGQDVVVALQRQDSQQWTTAPRHWLEQTITQLRQYTSRKVVVRPHPRFRAPVPEDCTIQTPQRLDNTYDDYDINRMFDNAWAVVNWNSGLSVKAAMSGVPVFVGDDSLAAPVANQDLTMIENPRRPERDGWLAMVAHTEWTLEEIAGGWPLERLLQTASR